MLDLALNNKKSVGSKKQRAAKKLENRNGLNEVIKSILTKNNLFNYINEA